MPSEEKLNPAQKHQVNDDLLDAQEMVREFDPAFTSLDRACDILEKSLEGLTQSPSSLVH